MAIETIAQIKTYFETGDRPTEAQFVNLIDTLANGGAKVYKALLSQNAPIASTNNDTMIAGQIWELSGAANPSDYGIIDGFELVSGTLYAASSKYRVSVDTPFTFSASAMEYDGAPYVVSTDANGNLNPFVNTLGGNPTFSYPSTAGKFRATLTGAFPVGKTIASFRKSNAWKAQRANDNAINFNTYSDYFVTEADDIINNWLFEIEVYP